MIQQPPTTNTNQVQQRTYTKNYEPKYKSKYLPTIQFIQTLQSICSADASKMNSYDRKNHILTIGNYESFETVLKIDFKRSVESYQRQLKMLGFKKKKTFINSDQRRERIRDKTSRQNDQHLQHTPIKEQNQPIDHTIGQHVKIQQSAEDQRVKQNKCSPPEKGFTKVQSPQSRRQNNQYMFHNTSPFQKLQQSQPQASEPFSSFKYPLQSESSNNQKPPFIPLPPQKPVCLKIQSSFSVHQQFLSNRQVEKRQNLEGQSQQTITHYSWRGKKEILIPRQLSNLESTLKTKLSKTDRLVQDVQKKREIMDRIMERLIFETMIGSSTNLTHEQINQKEQQKNQGEQQNGIANPNGDPQIHIGGPGGANQIRNNFIRRAIEEMRCVVNQVQRKTSQMGNQASQMLGQQLDLYRLLIYKERENVEEQKKD